MRRIPLFVLFALAAVALVVAIAPRADAPPEDTASEAPAPECAAEDPILTLDSYGSEEGQRKHPSPEAAVQHEVTSIYPKLGPQAFRQKKASGKSEFAHERNGQTLASAVVEQHDGGWVLEAFSACNSVLVDARRGGRP